MSIRIYNGVRLANVHTLEDMYSFIDSVGEPIKEKLHMNKARDMLSTACLIYDMHHAVGENYFEPDEDERIPLLSSSLRYMKFDRENETKDYSVGIGRVDGHTLAMYFFEDREAESIFLEHPQVEKFGYWTSTDPDEDVSKKEWALRKKLWNKLMDTRSAVPSESMFIIKITDSRLIFPQDKHMNNAMPDVEYRYNNVVNTLSFKLSSDAVIAESEKDEDCNINTKFGEMVSRAKEFKADAEAMTDIKKFKKDMTLAELSKNIPDNKEK